ncbi:hypothetical protein OO015_00435 [Thermomicrobium sp. 4228-Ro]|uniref:hypothetical protein n=1 Tax=Thermomicrobium sp. 4228-Ro TaxID=2993937 RepID=UPI002249210C|nr:hypothetical protein [Thermomicrobium sp. 4228-Ro]MCX2725974.1 hypothetical protein [Thermomicrobium sp. 4228-Ro]
MAIRNWYQNLQSHLIREFRRHRRELALGVEPRSLVVDALAVIEDLLSEAARDLGIEADVHQTHFLTLLYPDLAAEAWAALAILDDEELARERAREILRHASSMGYIGNVTAEDLETYDPVPSHAM